MTDREEPEAVIRIDFLSAGRVVFIRSRQRLSGRQGTLEVLGTNMHIQNVKTCILLLIITALSACASGSSIVTGTTRAQIDPNQVRLYADPPEKYETIGIVKASSDAGWTEQGSQDYAIEELKKQAANLGANGVLLTTTGENTSSILGTNPNGTFYAIPVSEQTVTGKAIYVGE